MAARRQAGPFYCALGVVGWVGVFLEGGGGAVLDFAYQKKKQFFCACRSVALRFPNLDRSLLVISLEPIQRSYYQT
jgi:hypothetical protein